LPGLFAFKSNGWTLLISDWRALDLRGAENLGRTQIKTTQRYSHLSQDTLLAAVNSAAETLGQGFARKTEMLVPQEL